MDCAACRQPNDTDASFCEQCGAKLARVCSTCGRELKATAKFCPGCGQEAAEGTPQRATGTPQPSPRSYTPKHLAEKILASRSALEGERKQVTVLFADIQGSMTLSERLDPEDWHRIMDRFFAIMTEGVHRFEGTVNQYTGDGIMALFGAPIAHEDHAQRACFAALRLQEALRTYANELRVERGLALSVRIGLNSGEVVVGRIGDDLRMDYTAQGHTVGLAARMQQLAEPGKTYLTGAAGDLARGYFELEELGTSAVKGVAERVQIYALSGVGELRTRLDLSRSRGFTRFVGRAREMSALDDALDHVVAGSGEVVGLVAEAGTGKSRLCYEFLERCRERGMTTYEAHCLPHGRAMPLAPVLELYRSVFGVEERDSDRTARDKIAGRIALIDEKLLEALPVLFDFLGVPDPERPVPQTDPDARTRQIIDILQRLTRARGEREPIVVLVEDLHWMDPGSQIFTEGLVEMVPAGRLLLLVNTRPEYSASWMGKTYYRQIPLAPLGDDAIDELFDDLLGEDESLVALREKIRQRTSGNPFFIEEMVRELAERQLIKGERGRYRLESPVESVPVPTSVHDVLAARIDRLEEEGKQIIQSASVIGRTFALDVLADTTKVPPAELEAILGDLVADEFIYVESLYPQPEYAFKHALTRDVAYASLLGERKKALHGALARVLEDRRGSKGDEHAALIAHHYQEADEPQRAAHWHERAAYWIGASNSRESFEHWQQVRALLARMEQTPETLVRRIQACQQAIFRGMRGGLRDLDIPALLSEAKAVAARCDRPVARILVLATEGGIEYSQGHLVRASALLDEALSSARAIGDTRVASGIFPFWNVVHALHKPARVCRQMDSFEDVDEAAYNDTLGYRAQGSLGCWRAYLEGLLGRGPAMIPLAEAALQRARADGDRIDISISLGLCAGLYELVGEVDRSLSLAREGIRVGDLSGAHIASTNAYSWFLFACAADPGGVSKEELATAATCLEQFALGFQRPAVPFAKALLEFVRGRFDESRTAIEQCKRQCETDGQVMIGAYVHLTAASMLLSTPGQVPQPAIEATLEDARELIENGELRGLAPRLNLCRARLLDAVGDRVGRERELRAARNLYAEIDAPKCIERVDALLAS